MAMQIEDKREPVRKELALDGSGNAVEPVRDVRVRALKAHNAPSGATVPGVTFVDGKEQAAGEYDATEAEAADLEARGLVERVGGKAKAKKEETAPPAPSETKVVGPSAAKVEKPSGKKGAVKR